MECRQGQHSLLTRLRKVVDGEIAGAELRAEALDDHGCVIGTGTRERFPARLGDAAELAKQMYFCLAMTVLGERMLIIILVV